MLCGYLILYKKMGIKMVTEELNKAYGSFFRHQLLKDNLMNKFITFDKIRLRKVSKRY